jgi:hypothetical protein
MPANKKYLSSGGQQAIRFLTAFIGGLLITSTLFACLSYWLPDYKTVVVTSVYGFFPIWLVLMLLPYLFRKAWKGLVLYGAIFSVLLALALIGKSLYPIVLK